MKVLFDAEFEYPDTVYFFYNYDKFSNDEKNLLYVYGIYGKDIPEEYKNKIYFNAEEPNGLYHSGVLLHERSLNGKKIYNGWTKIFQLCPYSTRWLRDVIGDKRYEFLPDIPICDEKYFPNPDEPKIYDVMYQGSVHGYRKDFLPCIEEISKFKYIWSSLSDEYYPKKTHLRVPYIEKLKLFSQCKMTIVDNKLYDPHPGAFATNIRKLPQWNLNEAFSHIDYGVMPQFKFKLFESMLCKNLVLAERGPWNVMEEFGLIEGEHFLYFDDSIDLNSTIQGCLAEWNHCEKIIENSYNKIISENSTENLYNKYLKQYDK